MAGSHHDWYKNPMSFLYDFLIIFAVALGVSALLKRVGIPVVAGFILAGILAGPSVLGLVPDFHQVEELAEVGVALLLFGIGIEISLEKLRYLWRPVLLGGGLQVGITAGVAIILAQALSFPPNQAIFIGFVTALSSTAIVLRGLTDSGDLQTPHGRLTLGILVFQDLAVLPMMLAIPFLAQWESVAWEGVVTQFLGSLGACIAILGAGRFLVPVFLKAVASLRQRELFILAVLVVTLAISLLVTKVGLSLPLGAFLAGLVVSGTQFRHHALSEVIPFRDVFTSLFFVSIGMLLNVEIVKTEPNQVLMLFLALVLGKFFIVGAVALLIRLPLRVAVLSGLALAQIGEFSFVLVASAKGTGLLDPHVEGIGSAAAILSMLFTPLLIRFAPHVAAGMGRVPWLEKSLHIRSARTVSMSDPPLKNHVVLAGYGISGLQVVEALQKEGQRYLVVELGIENVEKGLERGQSICLGDITSSSVLKAVGTQQAALFVLTINDVSASVRATKAARSLNPELRILARVPYEIDRHQLIQAGADIVISAEEEAAYRMAEQVLSELPEEN